jgi:outer membrane receptor protein involved in Fe transport
LLLSYERVDVFLLPRGSYRLPGRNVLDLRVDKAFAIPGGDLRLMMDIFNVFNTGYPLSVMNDYTKSYYEEPDSFSMPRQIRIGARFQF